MSLAVALMVTSCGGPRAPESPTAGAPSSDAVATAEFKKLWEAAYSKLPAKQQALVDQGRLMFDGESWGSAPGHLVWSTGIEPQSAVTSYQCPLDRDPNANDHGTFFLAAADAGTHFMSATFAVAPNFDTQVGPGEEVYVMFSGWASKEAGGFFDAGLEAIPPGGWTAFANTDNPDPNDPSGHVYESHAEPYRLWNASDRSAPMFVNVTVALDEDSNNRITVVAEALDDATWIPLSEFDQVMADPNYVPNLSLAKSTITLGSPSDPVRVDGFSLTQNPGIGLYGDENVMSVQYNLGKDATDPAPGMKLPYVATMLLEGGGDAASAQPINIFDDPRSSSKSYAFQTFCPGKYPGDVYRLDNGGSFDEASSAADNPSEAAVVSIVVQRSDANDAPPCGDGPPIFLLGVPDVPPSRFGVYCGPHATIYYQSNAVSNMGRPFNTMLGLENNGDATLHYEVSVNGGAVGLSTNAPTSGAVDPGRGTEIPLAGTCPSAVDWDTSGTVTITSDDPDTPLGPVPITVLCYQLEVSGSATVYVDGQPVSGLPNPTVVHPGQTLLLDGHVANVYDSTLDESVGWAIGKGPGAINAGQGPDGEPEFYYTAPTAGYADGAPLTLRVHSIAQPDVTNDINTSLAAVALLACESDAGGCSVGNLEYSYSVGSGQTKDISITSNDFSGQGATLEVTSGQGALSSTREHIPNGTAWSAPTVDIVHFTAPTLPCYNSGETQTHATTTVLATSNSDPQATETITFNTIGLVCQ